MFGELAQLSCVHDYEKTYWVLVEGDPTQDKLTQLELGIRLKDYRTLPAKARLIRSPNLPARPKPVTPRGLPRGRRSNSVKRKNARSAI